jgi:hypothetical protein
MNGIVQGVNTNRGGALRRAAEMMLIGSSIKVAPVVEWDGLPIGDRSPGPIAKKLLELWHEDTRSATDQLVPVPYPEGSRQITSA